MDKNINSRANSSHRQLILNSLNLIAPSAMLLSQLYRTIITSVPAYRWSQFEEDIPYLIKKHYIEFGVDLFEAPFSQKVVKLTAMGKDLADDILDDPALEI